MVGRYAHDANSDFKAFVVRVYLARRSTDRQFFKLLHSLTLIVQPGSGELMFFVPIDRQTDIIVISSWWGVWEACCLAVGVSVLNILSLDSGHSGLYCGDFLAVSILVCVRRGRCFKRERASLSNGIPILVTA